MDNHFHLVVETPQPNLGVGMKWLKAAYAQDFNQHLVSAIVYVALNPVRAGLAARPEHWPWSSYAPLTGRAPVPPFLNRDRVFELARLQPEAAEGAFAEAVLETMRAAPRRKDAMGVRPAGSDPGL